MEDDEKRLYPLAFLDDSEDFPWGHVSWKLADIGSKDSMVEHGWLGGNTLSDVMTTYLERLVGDNSFEFYGTQFPILIKKIETKGFQPLQMSVADTEAAVRFDAYGKTALWYIEDAAPDSRLALGFNRDVAPTEFYNRCKDGTVDGLLNILTPRKGDIFLISPGEVFAAGPGLKVLEISECSDLTFPLAGLFGSSSEAGPDTAEDGLSLSFDMINFGKYNPEPLILPGVRASQSAYTEKIASRDEFTVSKIDLRNLLHVSDEMETGFTIYYCLSGEASIQVPKEDTPETPQGSIPRPEFLDRYQLRAGHVILVPAEVSDFYLVPARDDTVLFEVVVDKRRVRDSYTNEQVDPSVLGNEDVPDPHVRDYD